MGPLAGIRVVEFAALGPGPFCAMMLADMGAEVLRVDRIEPREAGVVGALPSRFRVPNRSRRSVALDLKHKEAAALALRLVAKADALIEGFRPGTMERLGLGPDACLAANPRLVYGRMTGWGQDGPLAPRAGHDINYIAVAGALHAIGEAGRAPVPPLNLVGDYGGGGMVLAFGIVCALVERMASGRGQVVDAAMVDGTASLMAALAGLRAAGAWSDERGANMLDGGAPWYAVYETKDGRHVAIGAIERKFYDEFLRRAGVDPAGLPPREQREQWPALRAKLAAIFKARSRAEWDALLGDTDACVSPVLTPGEAAAHPHLKARGTFVAVDGIVQPAPAPRFSRSTPAAPTPPCAPGAHTREALADWGFTADEITALQEKMVIS